MTEKYCRHCHYFDREGFRELYEGSLSQLGLGLCRRNPPMPDLVRMTMNLRLKGSDKVIAFSIFPETASDDWCGEWAPRNPQVREVAPVYHLPVRCAPAYQDRPRRTMVWG